MNLTFLGAAHEVTGSCFYLQACNKNFLIDCGMEQGQDLYENEELKISPSEIDYVLLTHAHIDHSGNLPLLFSKGFRGSVCTTGATSSLCDIMLRDSAHIQMFEAEWKNRKAKRAGLPNIEPAYTMDDAIGVVECFKAFEYNKVITLCDGIKIRFIDVGHLLGSASIEIWITEDTVTKKIVFSGDIGNINQPLIKDPHYIDDADYVVMESTYGIRNHTTLPDYVKELSEIIKSTFDKGGNVVIPAFAVGRTQELLYFLRKIKADNLVEGYGNFPVYVDSPLAVEATNIFNDNIKGYFDSEAMELINAGISPISFPGLKISVTSDESKAINFDDQCKVIISASGMCEAGRIKHHLKHNLWRKESTIIFVGYQANGTLGRTILEGATKVKLFGEEIEVDARICKLDGISGHADNAGLIKWITSYKEKPTHVFVIHGEDSVCDTFAKQLVDEYGINATAPYSGDEYNLITDECIVSGPRIKIIKTKATTANTISPIYKELITSQNRLINLIKRSKDCSNKDIEKFTKELNKLYSEFDF